MGLSLDRMALDDVGGNPQRIAETIIEQLQYECGKVPVHQIAYALDIVEIRSENVSSFEGALLMTPERGYGSILVNSRSIPQRQRFTIGHELGHYLNPMHRPTTAMGFQCTVKDMRVLSLKDRDRHLRQEAEANSFAIELLAPGKRVKCFTQSAADIANVLSMAGDFDISKEAAARRYIALHDESLAIVFSKDNLFLYADRVRDFPWLCLNRNDPMPSLPPARHNSNLSHMKEAEASEWLSEPKGAYLSAQVLFQQNGYAMTLLRLGENDEDEDLGIDDAYQRYSQFDNRDRD